MQVTQKQSNMIVMAVEANEFLTISSDTTPANKIKIHFPEASVFSCYRKTNSVPLNIEVI